MINKIKALAICCVVAFIATMSYAYLSASGVRYTPGISTTEMDNMTYSEVVELMSERASSVPPDEAFASNLLTPYFWIEYSKIWIVITIISFISHLLASRFSQ